MTSSIPQTETSLEAKVRAAIAQLQREGKKITNNNVREITGGSFRDLGPIVKSVREDIAAKQAAASSLPEMPIELHEAMALIWSCAWKHADETAATERRAHAEVVERHKEYLVEAEEAVAVVEGERDKNLARAETAEAKNLALEAENADWRIRHSKLEGRLEELEKVLDEYKRLTRLSMSRENSRESATGIVSADQTDLQEPTPHSESEIASPT